MPTDTVGKMFGSAFDLPKKPKKNVKRHKVKGKSKKKK